MQALFVQTVVGIADQSMSNRSTSVVVAYAHTTLSLHVRNAIRAQETLHEHKWCLDLLLHSDLALVDQVLQGVDKKAVGNAAEWLRSHTGGDFTSAALLYQRLADMGRGNTTEEKITFLRACSAAAEQALSSGPLETTAISIAFSCRTSLIQFGAGEDHFEWILETLRDDAKAAQLEEYQRIRAERKIGECYIGAVHIYGVFTRIHVLSFGFTVGNSNTKHTISPSHKQMERGATAIIKATIRRLQMVEKNNIEGFMRFHHVNVVFGTYGSFTSCYVAAERLNTAVDFVLGEGGSRILAWANETRHERTQKSRQHLIQRHFKSRRTEVVCGATSTVMEMQREESHVRGTIHYARGFITRSCRTCIKVTF